MNTLYKNKGETSDKMQILGVGALFLFALFVLLLYPDNSAQQNTNQADNLCQQLNMMRAAEMTAQQKGKHKNVIATMLSKHGKINMAPCQSKTKQKPLFMNKESCRLQ